MSKKYRILFHRISEPGSKLETIIYVETIDEISDITRGIEGAFYQYFTSKKFKFLRAVEIPAPFHHPAGTDEFLYRERSKGEDSVLEGEE